MFPSKADPRYSFPMSFERYKALTTEALLQVKRSDPTAMIEQAPNTLKEGFADQCQPYDTARTILDDAMTGQRW